MLVFSSLSLYITITTAGLHDALIFAGGYILIGMFIGKMAFLSCSGQCGVSVLGSTQQSVILWLA